MSSEEMKDRAPGGDFDAADIDFQEKIEAAMDKIIAHTAEMNPDLLVVSHQQPPQIKSAVPNGKKRKSARPGHYSEQKPSRSARPQHYAEPPRGKTKSARPKQVSYVHYEEDDDKSVRIPPMKHKKKRKALKITGMLFTMMLAFVVCAYAAISYYYADKFFEGTVINGVDCSGLTAYEVELAIADQVDDYTIQVASRNLAPQIIAGTSIEYRYMSNGEVLNLLKQQKPYEWIRGYFEQRTYSASENIYYDKTLLQNEIIALECAKVENQIEPQDAYVAFTDTQFEIIPETEGSMLNIKEAYKLLDEAVSQSQPVMDFTSTPEAYVQAEVTSENPDLKAAMDACNNFTRANITYTFGDEVVTLDGSVIKDWLHFDDKGQLVRDDASFQQCIAEYVGQLAAQYDTVGTDREFYTTSGRVVYVYGSAYGWKIDQAAEIAQLTQEIQSGAQVTREPNYSMRANAHGHNDLGDTYIEVDLSYQHMYYYRNGAIIFDSDIVSGDMSYSDRQTPPGIFTLYYKKSPDVLRGAMKEDGTYEYEADVQYWMPFNGGIGFHDANWQPYFGGDRYLYGGSHGCINMPPSNAAVLYEIIEYDVPIICFY